VHPAFDALQHLAHLQVPGDLSSGSIHRRSLSLTVAFVRHTVVSEEQEDSGDHYKTISARLVGSKRKSSYRLYICVSRDLVVFSMDLTITRSLGVMGELACFRGLKFKITVKILFAILGRARIRMEREFKVASTRTASLRLLAMVGEEEREYSPDAFLEHA